MSCVLFNPLDKVTRPGLKCKCGQNVVLSTQGYFTLGLENKGIKLKKRIKNKQAQEKKYILAPIKNKFN